MILPVPLFADRMIIGVRKGSARDVPDKRPNTKTDIGIT